MVAPQFRGSLKVRTGFGGAGVPPAIFPWNRTPVNRGLTFIRTPESGVSSRVIQWGIVHWEGGVSAKGKARESAANG
jgi:hypothetical protein